MMGLFRASSTKQSKRKSTLPCCSYHQPCQQCTTSTAASFFQNQMQPFSRLLLVFQYLFLHTEPEKSGFSSTGLFQKNKKILSHRAASQLHQQWVHLTLPALTSSRPEVLHVCFPSLLWDPAGPGHCDLQTSTSMWNTLYIILHISSSHET